MDFGIIGLRIVRYLMLSLDLIAYNLIRVFYNLFFAISEIRLFASDSEIVKTISTRIYALIGIYALFKVTFILINMLINPDAVNDKQKGAGKIATRFVVMLMLIIAVPWIFTQAYKLQGLILEENLIGKILLGDESDPTSSNIKDAGGKAANEIFASFVMIDDGAATYSNDSDTPTNVVSACEKSYNALTTIGTNGISSLYSHIGTTYKDSNNDEEFCIKYTYFVSLLAGGFAAYVFAVYCLDIGLRVAKLAFYELVAPISIVTFIDGKKDGPFNNWLKSTVSTFLDLLIRLIIIYFIIFIIDKGLPELLKIDSLKSYDFFTRNFAKAIVMLGLLMFATQAPKLIKDLFGIKGDGSSDYGMGLGKKLAAAPAARAALAAGVVGAGAMAANSGKALADVVKNTKDAKGAGGKAWAITKGVGNVLTSPVAGGVSGMFRAGAAGAKKNATLGKTIGDQLQATSNKRDLRDYRSQAGYNVGRRTADKFSNFFGQDTIAKTQVKAREKNIQGMQGTLSMLRENARLGAQSLGIDADRMGYLDSLVKDKNGNYQEFNTKTGKYTNVTLTGNELSYRQQYADAVEKQYDEIVTAQKLKKTYDEAYDRMERKKKQG